MIELDDRVEVPISAIEHYSYCPRQCSLIHVEQTFEDNVYTVRGHLAHARVDLGDITVERGIRTLRSVPLWSDRLRLRGRADVVEIRPDGPFPVEHKVGRRHGSHADLQLCAQALCLEEMMDTSVPQGAIYYHATRQRVTIEFDAAMRALTERVVHDILAMLERQFLPPAPNDARCRHCSLVDACLPRVVAAAPRVRGVVSSLYVIHDEIHDED
jgi:CRISPR-associated exonuclease Cas4